MNSEETTIRERLNESLEKIDNLQMTQRRIFGSLGQQYVVDASGIRRTVDGISNLESRCWTLRRKANELRETLYSISSMMESNEIAVGDFTPSKDVDDTENLKQTAMELTRTCGVLSLSLYSQLRDLMHQEMEDVLKDFDQRMDNWMDVSSSSIASKMAMLSSMVKQIVDGELNKIMDNVTQVQIMSNAILNPERGQTMDGFMDSTMQTIADIHSACSDGKTELIQKVNDMFNQAIFALDGLNIRLKGNTLRTTISLTGRKFALECADDMFMMKSQTALKNVDSSGDSSSMKMAGDCLMFSVDSTCQVVALMSEIIQKMLDFSIILGTQMTDSAKDLSEQMIDASAMASTGFMRVIGEISSSDMAREFLPGLLDFIGDTVPDQDLSKDVVGTANRVAQKIVDLGRDSANDQLSTVGRRASSMFENLHKSIRRLASDAEKVVSDIMGGFLKGQSQFVADLDYRETDSVMRMRRVGMLGNMLHSRATTDVKYEESKKSMTTPWWKQRLDELKDQRRRYAEYLVDNSGIGAEKPEQPQPPDILPTDSKEERFRKQTEYEWKMQEYEDALAMWEKKREDAIKTAGGSELVAVDATIAAMETAVTSGEGTYLAAKLYTELGTDKSGYFGEHFGYNPGNEKIATGLLLCRNIGIVPGVDETDREHVLDIFTADRTINHPFWQELMEHETEQGDGLDKDILKAILSQDRDDIENAMKKILDKYGPGTRVGEYAMSLATDMYLFLDYDDPKYWNDELDDYWKKLGATKDNPLEIHEILESDLFDDSVRDLYRKLQKTKDQEDLRRLFATMAQYIPIHSPLLHALRDNVRKKYGFDIEDYIEDHTKQYTSEDWKKQLAEESARRKYQNDSTPFGSDAYGSDGGDSASSTGDSSPESSSKIDDNYPLFFWRGSPFDLKQSGPEMLMHDGDQQVFNPYGHPTGKWTMYSFRPKDTLKNIQEENYPMIAITPSSFQSLKSINKMLDSIPFVVVREFYFKNQANNIINFVKGVSEKAKEFTETVNKDVLKKAEDEEKSQTGATEAGIKKEVETFMSKAKKKFQNVDIKTATIDIPYILYCCLREKQWGNTYVFPYIVDSGTVINESSNESEWNGKGAGILEWIKSAAKGVSNLVGGAVTSITGSQAQPADLFPVPTWSNNSTEKISFQFPLVLINDHIIKARNNYMCVNTIIHNNRWMQKSVLAFPGALYELWLPTGQRHLMCTGTFKLYPLGLNRFTPNNFFEGYDWDNLGGDRGLRGADFEIGTVLGIPGGKDDPKGIKMPNRHLSQVEVIPDAFKLDIKFTSCLANNMNTSVFQYYVKMAAFNNYAGAAETDWERNYNGDFSPLGEYDKNLIDVVGKQFKSPDGNVNAPSTNTGDASADSEQPAPGDDGNGDNGSGNGDSGTGGENSENVPHNVSIMDSDNNPANLYPYQINELNNRIIQYNRGDIGLDDIFTNTKNEYAPDQIQKVVDYITNGDTKTSNPANKDTHNVSLVDAGSELAKNFGYGWDLNRLNARINDYNRGEITLDQFFDSNSGIVGVKDSAKAETLKYLMSNDKDQDTSKYLRHAAEAFISRDAKPKEAILSSGKEGNDILNKITKKMNEGINKYNAGEMSLDEIVDKYTNFPEYSKSQYDRDKLKKVLKDQLTSTDTSSNANGAKNKHNLPNVTMGQFTKDFGRPNPNETVDGKILSPDQLNSMTSNKSQLVLKHVNKASQQYNSGKSIDEVVAQTMKEYTQRKDIGTLTDLGFTPDRLESYIRTHLTTDGSRQMARSSRQSVSQNRKRVYSRNETSSETYIEKFNEATYNKKLQKLKTSIGDVPINADSAVLEIQNAQKTIRETTQFLSKLYNAENNNLWWKPFEREKLYYTLTPDARVVLRQRYGEKFISLKDIEVKIQNTMGTLDRITSELSKIPDLSDRNPLLEKKVATTRELNKLQKQKDSISDELIQIDTDLIRDAFDEHDAVVSIKRRDITVGIFKQVWNEKIMNSYEREQMQYLTSDEKKRYFDDKIREMAKWDTHEILKKKDWFFRVVVMDFIVGEMKVLVQWFKECTYNDFETVYRIVRKLRLLRLDFDQAVAESDFKINRTNLFRMTENQVMEFKKLDKLLTGNTLYELFLSQLEIQFEQDEDEETGSTGSGTGKIDKEIAQEMESEENLFKQRTVRQDVVTRYWGSETELTRAAYDKVCSQIDDESEEKITVYKGEDDVEVFDNIRMLKNEIMRLKIAGDTSGRLQALLGAFTSYVNLAKEAMVTEKMNEMLMMANKEIQTEDESVNAKVMSDDELEDVPFPSDYQ